VKILQLVEDDYLFQSAKNGSSQVFNIFAAGVKLAKNWKIQHP